MYMFCVVVFVVVSVRSDKLTQFSMFHWVVFCVCILDENDYDYVSVFSGVFFKIFSCS
jgi:hypothetical protein